MSKRLHVILADDEMAEIRRVARSHRITVAEWARQALRRAWREEPATDAKRKLAVVRDAAQHQYPTADVEAMLAQIGAGRTIVADE